MPEKTKKTIDLLKACDRAYTQCQQANKDKDEVIKGQKAQIDESVKRISELERKDSSLLNNKLLWFAIGALFTGSVVYLTKPNR